jgi:F1F0 ATPase subunit 2
MNETVALVLASVAGLLLGGIFFGGLWWTVRTGVSAKRPALLFLSSLLLRTAVTLTGFYVVGAGHWQRLLACLLGFVIARVMVTRFAGPPAEHYDARVKEAGHAP